jgi:hypothetical protein
MKNWAAVRISAGLSITGGALTVVFAAALATELLVAQMPYMGPFSPSIVKAAGILTSMVFAALGLWASLTGVAVLRRQRWSQISMLVLGAMLAFFGLAGLLAMSLISTPRPAGTDPDLASAVRGSIFLVYATVSAIGIWWALLFSRKGTREYFGDAQADGERARPMSITIIGYALLAQACIAAFSAVMQAPAYLFGGPYSGLVSVAFYTLHTAILLYLGCGLLQLDDTSRRVGVIYLSLVGANGVMTFLDPLKRGDVEIWEQGLQSMAHLHMPPNPQLFIGAAAALLGALLPVYFLIRRRAAFLAQDVQASAENAN